MKLIKTNTKMTCLSIVAFMIISCLSYSQSRTNLNCGSSDTRTVDGSIDEHDVSGLTSADTSKAINEYYKWIASNNSSVDCINEKNCKPAECVKKTVGVGGVEGNHPTPTYNDITGEWEFPKSEDAVIKCKCTTRAVAVFEIFEGGGVKPFDPLIGSDDPSRLPDNVKEDNITIYPNPAQDMISVDFNNNAIKGELTLRVYDQLGKLLEESTKVIESKGDNFEVYLDEYNTGLYYMTIHQGDIMISKSKFIVTED